MKKAIFKIVTLVISMLLLLAMFAACRGKDGAEGPAGPMGPQGPIGEDGKSAYELAVEQGFEGTITEWLAALVGAKGDTGSDGKSAYELAVEQGFKGTEGEWLASLEGAKGDTGVGIANITIDYKGIVVITLTNGEKYETTIDKACSHSNMESLITYPTCAEAGFTSYSCPDCGISYTDNYTAPSGHHIYNDKCLFCDYVVPFGEIEVDIAWYDSSLSTYTLNTREELAGLASLVNGGNNFSGKTIILGKHVDLGNAEWIPIGTNSTPFAGTFDGQGLTISNLRITNPTSYVGFFGYVSGAVKNFNITGANVTVNGTITIDSYAAIACGYSANSIVGVSTAGYLTATVTNYVGGVVGYVANSLQDCSNSAVISAPEANYVGGVAGRISLSGNYDLLNLKNSGSVTGVNYVGGIVGYWDNHATWSYNDSTYRNQLNGFINSGDVIGENYIGGIIGYTDAAITGSSSDGSVIVTVTEAKNNANVTGKNYVGGILGYAYTDNGSSQILKTASSGTITAEAYVGGLVGKIENIKLIECDNTGSKIVATYYVVDGTTYYAYVGGYAGYGGYIENCHNAVEIIYNEVGRYVGGVVGYTVGSMENCSNTAKITAEKASFIGGIAGRINYTGSYDVLTLTNSGAVIGADYVGGIIGYFSNHATWTYNDSTYHNKFTAFINSGNVLGENYVGGIIGYIDAAITGSSSDGSVILTITESKNSGNVTGKTYVGGILGYAYEDNGNSQINKTTSSGTIIAEAYVGGLVGKIENIKLIECDNAGSKVIATYYVADSTTYYAYVGGYAGYCGYVENCHNAVAIDYDERGMYVGGIAGYTVDSMVNCSNTASISAENTNYVGGVVGRFSGSGSYNFADISNSGDIIGADYVGGIMGSLNDIATWSYNDSTYKLNLTGINNSGNVTGNNYVGGFIGYSDSYISGSSSDGSVIVTMTDSENKANVTGDTYVGGIYGYAGSDNSASQITMTKSSGIITAKSHVGGLAGKLSTVKLIDCDNTGTQVIATSYAANGTTYYAYIGGYVGWGYYIEGCHNDVDITYTEIGSYVGGIAGEVNESIVDCSNTADIIAEKANYVGGIAGLLSATGNLELIDLTNSGAVKGVNYVSGIVGYFNDHATWSYNDTNYSVSIRNINNTADISGVKYIGGLIGRINAQITGSSSDGTVSVTVLESANSGNIIGEESVGSYFGEHYSDRTSNINGYVLTGTVNGAEVTLDNIIGVKSNINITEA